MSVEKGSPKVHRNLKLGTLAIERGQKICVCNLVTKVPIYRMKYVVAKN